MKYPFALVALHGSNGVPVPGNLMLLEHHKEAAGAGMFQRLLDGFNSLDPTTKGAIGGAVGLGGLGALSGMFAKKDKGRSMLGRGLLGALLGGAGGALAYPYLQGFMNRPQDGGASGPEVEPNWAGHQGTSVENPPIEGPYPRGPLDFSPPPRWDMMAGVDPTGAEALDPALSPLAASFEAGGGMQAPFYQRQAPPDWAGNFGVAP